jgi:hypothetical protein
VPPRNLGPSRRPIFPKEISCFRPRAETQDSMNHPLEVAAIGPILMVTLSEWDTRGVGMSIRSNFACDPGRPPV